ncbi:Cytochrome c biogenesis factor [Archaeoglobus sulfaticallidus PM70-1]|uniref:Cytochrome c biogenesis factor n=1 Tax=Archaeoglobus sulfaticallidus PM70-1 TaxID=387631 RepID=N0BDU7_9EURY|nr:cytochrome c biogenesis protein CcsA [Archaeoglobus sulfaticallidus]AGK61804.1 Cytochrome c biogenesis factor [Archaeoglobus sulfaticallidus PM70-1]
MDAGYLLILISFLLSIISSITLYLSINRSSFSSISIYTVYAYFLTIFLSCMLLLYHFLERDFTYLYVYMNSDSRLPLIYTISAFWAGKEGALLLWALFVSLMNLFAVSNGDRLSRLSVSISSFFFAFLTLLLLTTSNPFTRTQAFEGVGLNPLLRTIEMAIHPPLIFMSYSGFLIPFSMAIAGIYLGEKWTKKAYPYLLFSWISISAGIFVGALWAYKTLGWGGFWGWDPVENASFFPWLSSTALIHTVKREGRRTYLLTTLTFVLVVVAGYITRALPSDLSPHSFGVSSESKAFLMLVFILLAISVYFLFRIEGRKFEFGFNMEGLITLFIYLTVLLLFSILVGSCLTLFTNLKPDKNYYESLMIPYEAIVLVILGFCISRLKIRRYTYYILPVIVFAAIQFLFGNLLLSIFSALFVFSAVNLRKPSHVIIIHLGIMLIFMGSIGVWKASEKYTFTISENQTITADGYELRLIKIDSEDRRDSFIIKFRFEVLKDRKHVGFVEPRVIEYKIWRMERIVSSVGILNTPLEDIYVSTGISKDGIQLEVHINRLASLLWIGMALTLIGSFYRFLRISMLNL